MIVIALLAAALLLAAARAAPLPTQYHVKHQEHRTEPRIALAALYEPNGLWGSVVFKQLAPNAPVLVEASLHGIFSDNPTVSWGLYNEPVHYANTREHRCTKAALRGLAPGGDLSSNHGRATRGRFAAVGYDTGITLFNDRQGALPVVQRSLAVQQGNGPAEHVCATVYRVAANAVPPGSVPCERASYEDCAVTVSEGRCRRQPCVGWRQRWATDPNDHTTAAIDDDTAFCVVKYDMVPEIVNETVASDGTVGCGLGRHTGLVPIYEGAAR